MFACASDPAEVRAPGAYLTRAVVRRCLDQWKSARRQREQYVGAWLPEPLAGRMADDPAEREVLAESVSLAFLVVLESLNPVERAVFLLHDVFQYSFDEVAAFVDKSPAACRQIGRRARLKVGRQRPRQPASSEQHRQLVGRFLEACLSGELGELKAVLADDVVFYSDGGGLTPAARVPLEGIQRVVRFLLGLRSKQRRYRVPVRLEIRQINGAAGILQHINGQLHSIIVPEVDGDRIHRLYAILNPQKLAAIANDNPVEVEGDQA